MNIPMAYDTVPLTDAQQSPYGYPPQHGGVVNPTRGSAYGSHMTSVVVGSNLRGPSNSGLSAPLLLNDQEAQWAHEMANEGIGHLPVSWYRQTPKQALWNAYGLINRILSSLINFGLNVGIGYAILHPNDEVGLWQEPDRGDHPYKSAAWSDLYITTFFICFLTTVISTPGIRTAMKQGQTVPVDEELLRGGCWRCTPVSILGTCSRALVLSLWAMLFLCTPMIAGLEITCAAGGMHGSGAQCSMEKVTYIFIKATYAMVVAWIIYPLVLLMTLNTATLPPLDLTFFAQNQREKWENQQRQKALQPEPM